MTKPVSRRAFLSSLAASSVVVGCNYGSPGTPISTPTPTPTPTPSPTPTPTPTPSPTPTPTPTPTPAPNPARVPLTIDLSQANLPSGTKAYAYLVGGLITALAPASSPIVNYWVNASGTVSELSTADNTQDAGTFPDSSLLTPTDRGIIATTYPSTWADYSIPLSLTTATVMELGNIDTANIPHLGTGDNAFSARLYISIGVPKIPFTVLDADGISPNPFTGPALTAGTPGALCFFDWFEFSIDSNGNLNGNTTQVDQFGFPLTISVTPGGPAQGALNTSRAQLMTDLAGLSAPFANIFPVAVTASSAYPANTSYLRAFSPDHLSGAGSVNQQFDTYFDAAIATWYGNWSATPLVVHDVSTGYYSGMVVAGNLIFIQGNYATAGDWATANGATPPQINFGAITTAEVWQCNGALATGSTAQQNIGKQILAAFNRGAVGYLFDDANCPLATTYYNTAPFNVWAQSFHNFNANGFAYGFAYDDVCSQNPSVQTSSALQSANITVGAIFS